MLTDGINMEALQRNAVRVLVAGLNAELVEQRSKWVEDDKDFAREIGRADLADIRLEQYQRGRIMPGHHPEILEAPYEDFPCLSVMAYDSRQAPDTAGNDVLDANSVTLFVEVYCASYSIDRLNSIIHRNAEAVNNVIRANSTLLNVSEGIRRPPQANVGDVMDGKNASTARSETPWYWQGARLDYTIITYTTAF